MKIDLKQLDLNVRQWLAASRQQILLAMQSPLTVNTKSSRKDLVTNVDKMNQQFLVTQILAAYPDAHIEGEEGHEAKIDRLKGLVFIIDPIDGTMNFVKQKANFAVMIGVYCDGAPVYGAILDVWRDEVIVGGPDMPLMMNDQPLNHPEDVPLADGLLGVNGPMLINNRLHVAEIALASSGPRLLGSAGIEFKSVALGQQVGYISYLQPWDVAAGMAIGAAFGLKVTRPNGDALALLEPGVVVAAMPQAHAQIMEMMNA